MCGSALYDAPVRSLKGRLLVASPLLADRNFERSVIYRLEHDDENGAVGVVLNRPSPMALPDRLRGWRDLAAPPAVVFVGGPVEPQNGIGLARIAASPTVQAVDLHLEPVPDVHLAVRFFAGYAGWSAGQLEGELEEGGWVVLPAGSDDPLTDSPDDLWERVLRRQRGDVAALANFPPDPSWN